MKCQIGDIIIRFFDSNQYRIRLIISYNDKFFYTKLIKSNCGGYDGWLDDDSDYRLITNLEKIKYL